MFEIAENEMESEMGNAKIRVIGVGGGGCNAVNTMIRNGLKGVEYIVANTDAQALNASLAPTKVQLGAEVTKGLGAGANPEVGRKAAIEEYEKLSEILEGSDMVFVTAGMGGGTGTGAAPVIAKLCRELGALTVGVVTKPFMFEGKKRMKHAKAGIQALEESVDSLITIPNQKLLQIAGESLSLVETFQKADEVLLHAVQGISDLINNTGLINADFADVSTVMANKGLALMGTGICNGSDRAIKAANEAISSPLLEDITIDGATGIIVNITGDESLTTHEANEAMTLIMEAADEEAEIIFGTVIDETMNDEVKVTVIATGLGGQERVRAAAHRADRVEKAEQVASEPVRVEGPVRRQVNETFDQEPISMETIQPVTRREDKFQQIQSEVEQSYQVNTQVEEAPQVEEAQPQRNLASSIKDAANKFEQEKSYDSKREMTESRDSSGSSRAKSIAERLGFLNFDEDEFDSPSYLRKDEKSNYQPEQ